MIDPDRWQAERRTHLEAVRRHFADRPGSLLEIDVCRGGHGWAELAPFLGVPVPEVPFPRGDRQPLDRDPGRVPGPVGERLRGRVISLANRLARPATDDANPPLGAA